MERSGITQVCERLNVDRMRARQLVDTGFLGAYDMTASGRVSIATEKLDAVAEWPHVEAPHPNALVVRLANAKPVEPIDPAWPERRWTGFSTALSADELRDSARGWWRVRDPESWHGHLLVATIVGFVVGVWTIETHDNWYGGLRRFSVRGATDAEGADRFNRHQLHTGSGGNTAILEARDWSPS